MTVLPAILNLKVAPLQVLHFDSKTQQADEHGLIRDVPYDTAMVLINDEQHPAREATAEDLAAADEFDDAKGFSALAAATGTEFPPSVGIELAGPAVEIAPETPAAEVTAPADEADAAPHDGEPLPETAAE